MVQNGRGQGQVVKLHEAASAMSLSIYPNPTADMISILAMTDVGPTQVRLFDSSGRLVMNNENLVLRQGTNNLHIKGLVSGLYFMTIADGHGEIVKEKIIIK